MSVVNAFLVVCLGCLCLYLVGFINFLTTFEENSCAMTYMYEYPQFVEINVPENILFPRYGLYAYSEGRNTERSRAMHFDGIPVVFVPGNGGSYRQVRSLASVSLRKSLGSKTKFHFDFYTVDLNEELSGIYGGVLNQQTQFLNHSINAVLKLYRPNQYAPKSVIVVGHSMGGIIAQGMLTNPQSAEQINTVITLASPHCAPVIALDYLIDQYYQHVDNYWSENRPTNVSTTNEHISNGSEFNLKINDDQNDSVVNKEIVRQNDKHTVRNSSLSTKLLVTIGSGHRDILVPSGLTQSQFSNIHALTTSIPKVWLSTDHKSIVWCLQLVLVINRCLFSMVDQKSRQVSENFQFKLGALTHHLVEGFRRPNTRPVSFKPSNEWSEDSRRTHSVSFKKGLNRTRFEMIRLHDSHLHQALTIEAINMDDDDWIFGCAANHVYENSRYCDEGTSLSHYVRLLPSKMYSRKVAYLDLHQIRKKNPTWTHVIVRILPTDEPVQLNFDVYDRNSRTVVAFSPPLVSRGISVVENTQPNVIHYDIMMPWFDQVHQVLSLHVAPIKCSAKRHHSVATLHVPWAPGHSSVHHITDSQYTPILLRLHKARPSSFNTAKGPRVRLVLDPSCQYSISIRIPLMDSLGQLARHHSTAILPYMGAILILVLRQQLLHVKETGHCCNLLTALTSGAKPYFVITVTKLSWRFIGTDPNLPMMLLLALYAVCWALVYLIGVGSYLAIVLFGKTAHEILLRLMWGGWSGWLLSGFQKLPLSVGVILVALASSTCGALALVVGLLFYFVLLTKMYEDYLEDLLYKTVGKITRKLFWQTNKKDNKSKEQPGKSQLNENNSTVNENNVAETEDTAKENVKRTDDDSIETSQKKLPTIASNMDEAYGTSDSGAGGDTANRSNVTMPNPEDSISSIHFHLTVFLIWALITFLSIPALLTWAHNFKYNPSLDPDPSFLPSLILCISGAVLWQLDVPKPNLKYSREMGHFLYVVASATIIFSSVKIYKVTYFLIFTILVILVHQIMSPIEMSSEEVDEVDDILEQDVVEESTQEDNVEVKESVDNNSAPGDRNNENKVKKRQTKSKTQRKKST